MNDEPERPALRIVASNDHLPVRQPPGYDDRAAQREFIDRAFRRARMEVRGFTNGKPNNPLLRD